MIEHESSQTMGAMHHYALNVLYIEDENDIREFMTQALERRVERVITAVDGEDGWSTYKTSRPDIVITDIKMPKMDGLTLAKYIKASDPQVPVIVATAHSETELLVEAIRAGVDEILFKPIEFSQLVRLLEKYDYIVQSNKKLRYMRHLLVGYKRVIDEGYLFLKTDLDFRITYVNNLITDKLGYNKSQLLDKDLSFLIDQELYSIKIGMIKETLSHRLIFKDRFTFVAADGQRLLVEVSIVPLMDEDEEGIEYVLVGEDVTEFVLRGRKIQELQKIKESEEVFRSIANSVPSLIWMSDDRCERVFFNKTWQDFTGMQLDEPNASGWTDAVHPADMIRLDTICQERLDARRSYVLEYRLRRSDGEYRIMQESAAPRFAERNNFLGFVGSCTDITELKNVDALKERVDREVKRRMEQESMLVQQSKLAAMGEMIGAIAHQWRQPLAAISSATMNMTLKRSLGGLSDEVFSRIIGDIEAQTQRMSKTISDFMNFFKPDKQKEQFDMKSVINDVYGLLSSQLLHRGIEVVNDVSQEIVAFGYKNELEQVLLNIFINARDAFENFAGESKRLLITAQQRGDTIHLIIEDNAGGIEESIIDRIFEPYFTTKEEGKGTGIGLYMSKMIMQNSFGGNVQVFNVYSGSEERLGARFVVAMKQG